MPTTYYPLFSAPLSSALRARTKRSCISRGAPPRASLTHPRPHFTTKFVSGLQDSRGRARSRAACRVLAACPAFCSLPCLGSLIQKLQLCCHCTWQHRNSQCLGCKPKPLSSLTSRDPVTCSSPSSSLHLHPQPSSKGSGAQKRGCLTHHLQTSDGESCCFQRSFAL